MYDFHNNVDIVAAIPNANVTSNTTTDADNNVHMEDGEMLEFFMLVGNYTDGTYEPFVEEADDDGNGSPDTWADVADEDLLGTEAGAALAAAGVAKIGYIGTKEWVRCGVTSTSVSTGADVSIVGVKGFMRHNPQTTQTVT